MCKEIDSDSGTRESISSRTTKSTTTYSLPSPEEPPKQIIDQIRLPDHTTGLGGDPYKITLQNDLGDLDISDLSGK
ncbi:hypothetical protein TVAG_386110 [Trichomonas vaginalis G3]|uniref:Uncharacterized protein n=1 Tax=Trichomonas vaginalis (strain ATCC PRA-98 / G3) TaxID=412133 RepID=A2FSC8_TRIV3|nr:hypothetical protein TVAGG3_0969110 [Trichomonas vaginalis G3]EAX92187.1 hypothetical protein TVAG_386110 [Trichomonas vaginalis G3]KAI5488462.1 hypothetical protein TVAGG3_0969110 [Trichomonas vaginalis G3]|eukprot:XP_001305117.1 hypothetical protein [Trichomonas vaginalis G3]